MASTLQAPPNHYETLGLTPNATPAEIAAAFAREISPYRPRPLGGIAQVSLAYETLRDPVKRRAYDDSLGLNPEPKPAVPLLPAGGLGGTVTVAPPASARRKADYLFASKPAAEPPRTAAPREPSRPVAREPNPISAARSRTPPRPPEVASPDVEKRIQDYLAMRRAGMDRHPAIAELGADWKRPALIVGGVVGAVALVGLIAGSWAASDIEAEPAEAVASVIVPDAQARAPDDAAPQEPQLRAEAPAAAAVPRPKSRPAPVAMIKPVAPVQQPAASETPDEGVVQASELEEIAVERVSAEAPAAPATPAALPLPNKVVARTIERIGYSCGQVESTTPVEGAAPGVFKVTCSSGQSYRAAPTRGRYHFRRWERL
ncbi:MAG: DnaJ domain-containing protein [Alphaproteobacteria bacterium]